jgi:hypothetical protein
MSTAPQPIPEDNLAVVMAAIDDAPRIIRVPEVLPPGPKSAEALKRLGPRGRRVLNVVAAAGLLGAIGTRPQPPEKFGAGAGRCFCGRTISLNKASCMECLKEQEAEAEADQWGKQLAEKIGNQAMLDKVLEEAPSDAARAIIMRYIQKHLAFEPEQDYPIADCPRCGLKRGTMIAHECIIDEPPTIP